MTTQQYAAEAFLPGHPDHLGDAIADALVEEASQRQKRALVEVQVALQQATVHLSGRIACVDAEGIDVSGIVRQVYENAGLGTETLRIEHNLVLGPLEDEESRSLAAEQTIARGYAVDLPGTNYLPPEQALVHDLKQGLTRLRQECPELQLGPAGQLIVLLEEEDACPRRLTGVSVSLQQSPAGSAVELHRAVRGVLGERLSGFSRAVPGFDARVPEAIAIHASPSHAGRGQSGQKVVIDTYGPRVPTGGGSLSGKDFYHPDRAGALIARRLAKALVFTGLARECQATLTVIPGQREGQIVSLVGDGRVLDPSRWATLLDRSLSGAGERYTKTTSLAEVARLGHFLRGDFPWEQLHLDYPLS
jgi:S-adenosylmethionine synthetase